MALINSSAIPSDWANTAGWTRSYSSSPLLSDRNAKRPLIPADKAKDAPTLVELLDSENQASPIGFCGFLTSMDNAYAIIDIDAPKDVKKMILAAQAANQTAAEDAQISIPDLVATHVLLSAPKAVQNLLSITYCEYSVSKTGVHVVLKMDKSLLPKKRAYKHPKDFLGQLSISNNYMVATGDKLDISPSTVAEVPYSILDILFGISESDSSQSKAQKSEQDSQLIGSSEAILAAEALPSLQEVEAALKLLPLDQSPRIKEVYKKALETEYEHYNYWLQVGMALHNYGQVAKQNANCLALYLTWSATDPTAYTSDADVSAKWDSFRTAEEGLTYKTIFKLANSFEFQYPRPVIKDGRRLINPDKNEYCNFKYLMDKYDIKLHMADGTSIYVSGDNDILEKYFHAHNAKWLFGYLGPIESAGLQAATWRLCQDSHWRGLSGTQNFVNAWLTEPKDELDIFKLWLDTEEKDLPEELQYVLMPDQRRVHISEFNENSTFDYLKSCVTFDDAQDTALSTKMMYKTFMQLIKFHEPVSLAFEDNGGMFALIGPENTYKTTFFKKLLPQGLEFLRKDVNQELNSEKNKRDFVRYLGTKTIVLIDEFEGFMDNKKSGSFFKSIISGNSASFTDIYQTAESKLRRRAILVGTSNETKQIISDNGSRRLWYAMITGIDTNKLICMNLHKFYRDMREEFRAEVSNGGTPWLLSKKETERVSVQNEGIKARSSLDLDLADMFPYTTSYNVDECGDDIAYLIPKATATSILASSDDAPTRFLKTSQVKKLLKFNGYSDVATAELERALERFCKRFIGQKKKAMIDLSRGNRTPAVIHNGRLCMNRRADNYWNYSYWIVPVAEDFKESD